MVGEINTKDLYFHLSKHSILSYLTVFPSVKKSLAFKAKFPMCEMNKGG